MLLGAGGASIFEQEAVAFQKKNPSITVTFKTEADNVYNSVAPRDLAGDNAPDLVWWPQPQLLVKDKLLASLEPYAKKYNWTKRIPKTALNAGRINGQGRAGTGTLYGFSANAGPAIGVFYNRQLATQVGMKTVPTTLGAFEKILARAKAKNITPFVLDNKDAAGMFHLHTLLLGQYMGVRAINRFVYDAPGASIDTPAAIQATTLLQKWIEDGYFNADANAVDQATSYGLFAGGKGLFLVQGNWAVPYLDKADFRGKYGFFPIPLKTAGSTYTMSHFDAFPLSISAKSAHKDAAAEFLNFLLTKPARTIAVANGYEVAVKGIKAPAPLSAPLSKQLAAGYSSAANANGLHGLPIVASPSLGTLWIPEYQLFFAGQETPTGMLTKVQAAYNKDLGR
jgi:ABC-type glycerol-3-phosphate transport system substrate-binding protein